MRELAPLLFIVALAVPFGDAGALPSPAPDACGFGGAIRADVAAGEHGALGPDLLAPFAVAAPSPAEGSPGGTDGPRRTITVLPRRVPAPESFQPVGPPARGARDASCRAAPGVALRAFPAHPSTAPPRIA